MDDVSRGNRKIAQRDFSTFGALAIVDQGSSPVAGYTDDVSAAVSVSPPAIVFGDHTRVFKYVDHPFAMGADGIKVLRVRTGFDAKYVYHYLAAQCLPNAGYSRHFKFLKEIRVPKPGLQEQGRIAAILDQADAIRTKRRQVLTHLDALPRARFAALEVTGSANSQPLAAVARTTSGGTPSRRNADSYGGDIPWVKSGELHQELITETEESLTQAGLKGSSASLLPAGTVVMAMYGATAGAVSRLGVDAATNQAVCAFHPGPELRPIYLLWALRAQSRLLLSRRSGGAQPNLSQGTIRSLTLPVPTLEVQQYFEEEMRTVERQRTLLFDALVNDDQLFSSLQSRAFRGEL